MNVLANDGISKEGALKLNEAGFNTTVESIDQSKIIDYINDNNIEVLLVRSATKVRKDLIDSCKSLKIIGRGGVGMDNIDVEYAIDQGLHVINTPEASSQSVAELVFAHLYGMVRFLHQSNREMPLEGDTRFKNLKKAYGNGIELQGKTIGIIGFGRIGQAVAKIAIGLGMKVVAYDAYVENAIIELSFFDGQKLAFDIQVQPLDDVLSTSDFITVHVPAQENYILGKTEFDKMKDGTCVINAARGGVMDEIALFNAMEEGKIQFAGLELFEKEPSPEIQLLMNPNLSLSPHIGAATNEAQERIGEELASQIIRLLKEE